MYYKCDFLFNHFDDDAYDRLIETYASEYCSNVKSEEKLVKIFNEIINSNIKYIIPTGFEWEGLILDLIRQIIIHKPGRMLFKRLMKTNENLIIKHSTEKDVKPHYSKQDKEVLIATAHEIYCVTLNRFKQKEFLKLENIFKLIHELIHALHDLESPKEDNHLVVEGLINSSLDNLEEQHTIYGIKKNELGEYIFDPICENTFHKIYNVPLRIDHRGAGVEPGSSPSVLDAACCGVLKHLKSILDVNPNALNQYYIKNGERYTLLTAAIQYQQEDVIDFLLTKEVDIHLIDQLGGALSAAIDKGNIAVIRRLVQMGAVIPSQCTLKESCLAKVIKSYHSENSREMNEKLLAILKEIPWGKTIDEPDIQGNPPLIQALEAGFGEGFATLIELGADVSNLKKSEDPLLIYFLKKLQLDKDDVWENSFDAEKAFDLLISAKGVDVNACNWLAETPLSISERLKNNYYSRRLKEQGAQGYSGQQLPEIYF